MKSDQRATEFEIGGSSGGPTAVLGGEEKTEGQRSHDLRMRTHDVQNVESERKGGGCLVVGRVCDERQGGEK